jgi:hypothetical protein
MIGAASGVVSTYDKSAPTLSELIAAKYGAPEYLFQLIKKRCYDLKMNKFVFV